MANDRGLNILQYEKQTRLIDSLLHAKVNIYQKSTENYYNLSRIFRNIVLQEFELKTFCTVF